MRSTFRICVNSLLISCRPAIRSLGDAVPAWHCLLCCIAGTSLRLLAAYPGKPRFT
jgi:hypothetical protein